MPRKPSNIIYSADESPSLGTLFIIGLQHAVLALLFLVYPLVSAIEAGLPFDQVRQLITSCIIFMGIATIVASWKRTGAGILLVQIPNSMHLPLAVQSLSAGGLPLYAAMTLIASVTQLSLSRFLNTLRAVFPPEVCGVAVTMLGVTLAEPALRRIFGLSEGAVDSRYFLVGLASLFIIVVLAIFSRGLLRLFAVAIGAGGGWILAYQAGLAPQASEAFAELAYFDLPHIGWPGLAFSWSLVPAAILTGLISSIDMLGTVVSMQRMNDADWRRADMGQAERAIRANGLADIGAAVTGGFASASSSAAVGIAFATGTTAWRVGIVAGVLILLAAFSPRLIGALTVIPSPVIGAILIYASTFLIVAGMDLILSRRLSDRRIFTVGLSVIAGLSVAILPELVTHTPFWLHPILESPLSVSTFLAIAFNLFFRIGIRQEASITVRQGDDTYVTSLDFLERQAGLWGARRDVVAAAVPIVAEGVEMLLDTGLAHDGLELRARFDENNFDVSLIYEGEAVNIPTQRPSPEDLLGDADAVAGFVGYMLSKRADKLIPGKIGDRQSLTLRFEH